jgi:ligand-binding sensor domain-containing protein/signal transduction histidine kinase
MLINEICFSEETSVPAMQTFSICALRQIDRHAAIERIQHETLTLRFLLSARTSFARSKHSAVLYNPSLWLSLLWIFAVLTSVAEKRSSNAVSAELGFQNGQRTYVIDSWQMGDGLPGQTVNAVVESPDGYLWVGTDSGLARFDGSRFRNYTRENTPAIADDNIRHLLVARDGSIWIGTDGGGVVEYNKGSFHSYISRNIPGSAFVLGLYQSSDQVIWVSTDAGLFRVQNDYLVLANQELGIPAVPANEAKRDRSAIDAVTEDRSGRMWVGGSQLFASIHGHAREFALQPKDSRTHIRTLLESRDGSIWAGTVEGLFCLPPGASKFSRVSGVAGTIRTLYEDQSGNLWVGSITEGVYIIRDSKVTRLTETKTHIDNTVLSIFGDSEQNIWIGTRKGLTRLSRSSVRVVQFPANVGSDFGTISTDAGGDLWAPSSELFHVHGDTVTPRRIAGLRGVLIRSIYHDRDHSMWIGTDGSGLYHVTPAATIHYETSDGLVNNYIRCVIESRDGTMWIGTDGGMSHLARDGFHNFRESNGLAFNSIRSIVQDRHGDIWVGTDHGLSHMREGKFVDDAATLALKQVKVWSIFEDSDGMWFGTRGAGLYWYTGGRIAQFGTDRGLVSDTIYCILEDEHKRLWLSSPYAVMLVERDELTREAGDSARLISIRTYSANRASGVTELYGGTQPSGVLLQSGGAAFPATHGLWIIHPGWDAKPGLTHMHIESVAVDGKTVIPDGSLNLPAGNGRIEISYELVSLHPQDQWRFRYKLSGFDPDWILAKPDQRTATYTNVPPGHYVFHIEVWEAGQSKSKANATLGIFKQQFVHDTFWFRTLCVLALVGLLILAYYIRLNQLHKRFEVVVAERIRLAQEMHDTVIQGCASVSALLNAASSGDVEDNESRLHMIQYASTQIKATMDEARQTIVGLRIGPQTAVELIQALEGITRRIMREHGVETSLVVDGDIFPLAPRTSHSLAMVVREAIFNAILHARPESIKVELRFSSDTLEIVVTDDGQGFTSEALQPEDHFGIQGMRERIAVFGGQLQIRSVRETGTVVRVMLPRVGLLPL